MTLTVASYNIRKAIGLDRRRDPQRILEVLRELDADIIALQEADRRFGERMSAIPLHWFEEHSPYRPLPMAIRPHSIGWHGNAILVRRDHEADDAQPLHLPAIEPRGAVSARIAAKGHCIRVVGMHLDLSGIRRAQQARAVLHHLAHDGAAEPAVLMGDLNEWSPRGGCLREFGQHFRDVDTGCSFHSRRPVARLDRIFVAPEFAVEDAGVHYSPAAATASDHLPVWARLRLATA